MNQLIVPYGRNSSVTLSDGTIAFLNAGSSLVYPSVFGKKNREVFLVGEGYFQVAHNPEKPFVVKTNKLNVRALGTCFNVQAYPEDDIIEVVLVEGKVSLSDNTFRFINKDYMLKPNQLASYNVKNSETTVRQVDPENYVSWYEGYMNFESIELSRIVLKLERFYNIRLKLDNPFMGGKKISGKLKLKENKDEVLEILASTASAKLIKLDEQIYVLK
jgi:ferric-dicitrate binding protein FerR (iron transport regulator)